MQPGVSPEKVKGTKTGLWTTTISQISGLTSPKNESRGREGNLKLSRFRGQGVPLRLERVVRTVIEYKHHSHGVSLQKKPRKQDGVLKELMCTTSGYFLLTV